MTDLYDLPGHLIRRLQRMAVAVFTARVSEAGFDLTPVQFGALSVIGDHPGIDQASLAGRIAYDRVTIGGVVDRLCQKGLVQRAVNPQDRRARVLELTEPGRALLAQVTPVVVAAQQAILDGLSAEEARMFMALTRKLLNYARDGDTGDDDAAPGR